MKKTIIVLTTLLLTITQTVFAEEENGRVWTLNECILYAVENSPRTNTQRFQTEIDKQDYKIAIGNLLPSINMGTSANFNFGRGVDAQTNTYVNVNSFSNSYNLSASLVLFDGLANYNRVKFNKVNRLLGKHQLEYDKDMVAYETMEAYFQVLYNMDLVSIAEQQLEESDHNLRQVTRMEELGMKGSPDVAEIEAKQAEDAYNLTRQKNILTISIILLKEKMSFPIEKSLSIAHEDFGEAAIEKIAESAEGIYQTSKNINPMALAAESSYMTYKFSHRVSRGRLMPTISVSAGVGTNFSRYMDGSSYESFSDQFKNRRGEFIGFNLSIPIFSGFSASGGVKKARANRYIAEIDRDNKLRTLFSEIEQAVADTNGQVDEYTQASKHKESAQVAYNVNKRKYDEGMIDPIILHTSANRLMRAKAEELNAKYVYHLKYKLVKYYCGEPLFTE